MSSRHPTFVHELLEGRVVLARLHTWLDEQRQLHPRRDDHQLVGISIEEWQLVQRSPVALRYIIYARRFARTSVTPPATAQRARELSLEIAAMSCDPFDIAELGAWIDAQTTDTEPAVAGHV